MATMFDYHTIVVGTDGSPLAAPTVNRAAWLAAHNNADLVRLLRADAAAGGTHGRIHGWRCTGRADSQPCGGQFGDRPRRAAGCDDLGGLLVEAEPATAVLATATDRSADLVVVGAVRDAGIAERLLGSVATEVVRRADCEVLVVRPRREQTEDRPT
jgi:nucleotide-binding universal stress UspA family protein